jgi:hypothetical protein
LLQTLDKDSIAGFALQKRFLGYYGSACFAFFFLTGLGKATSSILSRICGNFGSELNNTL